MQNGNTDRMMNEHREKMVRTNAAIIWGMLGFGFPILLLAGIWKIRTADDQDVNFLNTYAWIPTNLDEQKMQLVMPMYFLALVVLVMAFVLPNLIFKVGVKDLPNKPSAATNTGAANTWFLRLSLRVAFLELVTILGFAAAFLAKQAELIMPFFILTMIGASMSSPESFIENK